MSNLSQVKAGKNAVIAELECLGKSKQRFIDLGIFKGTEVCVKAVAPLGDPMIIEVKDCQMAIRRSDAQKLLVF